MPILQIVWVEVQMTNDLYSFCAKYMKFKTGTFYGVMTKFGTDDKKVFFSMFCRRTGKTRTFIFPQEYLTMKDEDWQKLEK